MAYFNNQKYFHDGVSFRSKDEVYFWKWCVNQKAKGKLINFEYEVHTFTLMEKFRFDGELIRAITYKPDFKLYHVDGSEEFIEIKGMVTNEATLKIKLFKNHLHNNYPEIKYRLLSRSLKWGNIDGEWIEYGELQKIRRVEKKERQW